jgi:hypothetical protein
MMTESPTTRKLSSMEQGAEIVGWVKEAQGKYGFDQGIAKRLAFWRWRARKKGETGTRYIELGMMRYGGN